MHEANGDPDFLNSSMGSLVMNATCAHFMANTFPTGQLAERAARGRPSRWYARNLWPVLSCLHVMRVGGHGEGPTGHVILTCSKKRTKTFKKNKGIEMATASLMDIRQILVETHGVPLHVMSRFFQVMVDEGFAMFSKEANMFANGQSVEFWFVKLSPGFWKT